MATTRQLAILVTLMAIAACGRLRFEDHPRADAATMNVADGSDGADGADAASAELCNGIDDNGDGRIDEGCPCTPFDITTSSEFLNDDYPGFAWLGDGYSVITRDTSTKFAIRLSESGLITNTTSLGALAEVVQPKATDVMAWAGDRVAIIAVSSAGAVVLTLLDSSGAPIGAPVMVDAGPGTEAHVIWAGDRFAAAWHEPSNATTLHIVELARDGSLLAPAQSFTIADAFFLQWLARADTGYLLGIVTASSLAVVVHYDPIAGPTEIPLGLPSSGNYLQIVRGPGGFAAIDANPGIDPFVQLLAPDGTPRTSATPIPMFSDTVSYAAVVAASATTYRIVAELSYTSPKSIGYTELEGDGNVVVPPTPTPATFATGGWSGNSLVAADRRDATAWTYDPTTLRVIQHCY